MQTTTKNLVEELFTITATSTRIASAFKALTTDQLNYKKTEESWSILECIEHLNLYGDFYLPEIEKQMLSYKGNAASPVFKSGIIGNYFANLMKVNNGKIKKMKSPKDKNPAGSRLSILTIEKFMKQQALLKALLTQSLTADLTHIKVPISISKFIKLRLGDTFRFFVYHIERHITQAEKVSMSFHKQPTTVEIIL